MSVFILHKSEIGKTLIHVDIRWKRTPDKKLQNGKTGIGFARRKAQLQSAIG